MKCFKAEMKVLVLGLAIFIHLVIAHNTKLSQSWKAPTKKRQELTTSAVDDTTRTTIEINEGVTTSGETTHSPSSSELEASELKVASMLEGYHLEHRDEASSDVYSLFNPQRLWNPSQEAVHSMYNTADNLYNRYSALLKQRNSCSLKTQNTLQAELSTLITELRNQTDLAANQSGEQTVILDKILKIMNGSLSPLVVPEEVDNALLNTTRSPSSSELDASELKVASMLEGYHLEHRDDTTRTTTEINEGVTTSGESSNDQYTHNLAKALEASHAVVEAHLYEIKELLFTRINASELEALISSKSAQNKVDIKDMLDEQLKKQMADIADISKELSYLQLLTLASAGKGWSLPVDCNDVKTMGRADGVHVIQPPSIDPITVWCEGGWTHVQKRHIGNLSFNKSLHEYEYGFGSPRFDHWIGLRPLHALTAAFNYTLEMSLIFDDQMNGSATLHATQFSVGSPIAGYQVSAPFMKSMDIGSELGSSKIEQLRDSLDGSIFTVTESNTDYCHGVLQSGWWVPSSGCAWMDLNTNQGNGSRAGCSPENLVCARLGSAMLKQVILKMSRV